MPSEDQGLGALEALMARAVAEDDFETAAMLRDQIAGLQTGVDPPLPPSRIRLQEPGKMGLGTSTETYARPPGWKPPPKPDPMTGGRSKPRGRR